MALTCIIFDDEPLAQKVLLNYAAKLPSLRVPHTCANAMEAAAFLHENPVDFMFLDNKMPGLTDFDLLESLSLTPKKIIMTASGADGTAPEIIRKQKT